MSFSAADTFLNFLFHLIQFGVLLLNLQLVFQLVDFWDLGNNFSSLFLKSLDHGQVEFAWLVLVKHFVDRGLHGIGFVVDILLEGANVGLDRLQLGDGERSAHFSLLGIAKSLVQL